MDNLIDIKKGDQSAFARTFEMHHKKVFAFFMRRINGDRDAAKDLTQLTFIKLWQSKHTLSLQHTLDKQIFIIAKYTLIDYIRKEAVVQKTTAALTVARGTEYENDATISGFEEKDYVQAVLKDLPPVRKKILQMKVLQGYSNKEIAEQLSISIKTVEDHITKGFRDIRQQVKMPAAFVLFFLVNPVFWHIN